MTTVVNLIDYGADPTGVDDSLPAVQQAIAAAGPGGRIMAPKGVLRISDQFTMTPGQSLIGDNTCWFVGESVDDMPEQFR